jgi:hypothetical protein
MPFAACCPPAARHESGNTNGNLSSMQTFTEETRARIAQGWAASGLTQD